MGVYISYKRAIERLLRVFILVINAQLKGYLGCLYLGVFFLLYVGLRPTLFRAFGPRFSLRSNIGIVKGYLGG